MVRRNAIALVLSLLGRLVTNAQDWNFEVKKDSADPTKVAIQVKGDVTATTVPAPLAESKLKIECTPPADCTKIGAKLNETAIALTGGAQAVTGRVTKQALTEGANTLSIAYAGGPPRTFAVKGASRTGEVASEPTDQPVGVGVLLKTSCPALPRITPYDLKTRKAGFLIDPLGNVLTATGEPIDESFTVEVTVLADTRLLPFLHVKRKSAIRVIGGVSIIGEGLTVPAGAVRQAAKEPTCGTKVFVLHDFAPGKGEVAISVQADGKDTEIGGFELLVDTLYDGLFSLGVISSDLVDRTFKLRPAGTDKRIFSTEEGKSILYTVMYTPFVWAQRDIRRTVPVYQHLNPMVGISLNEIGKHAIAGISLDFQGFVLSIGEHWARVTVLSASSGLKEGDVFAGQESEIPTARKWRHDHFFGAGIDLRAAVKLLKTITTGSPGQ
jgi:hypothetical protein